MKDKEMATESKLSSIPYFVFLMMHSVVGLNGAQRSFMHSSPVKFSVHILEIYSAILNNTLIYL